VSTPNGKRLHEQRRQRPELLIETFGIQHEEQRPEERLIKEEKIKEDKTTRNTSK